MAINAKTLNKLTGAVQGAAGAASQAMKQAAVGGKGTGNHASAVTESAASSAAGSYVPRDISGNDYAGLVGMSDIDKAAIQAAKDSYAAAQASGNKAAMEAAHQQAESIRQKYGYSGGVDGSQYIDKTMPEIDVPSFDSFMQRAGYSSAMEDLSAASAAYIEQLENAAKQQAKSVEQGYDDAARQAYVAYMNSRRTLPQRMSASGLSGGLADSQEIALETGLQETQNDIALQRQNALQELQNLLAQNKLAIEQGRRSDLASMKQAASNAYQTFGQNYINHYLNQFNLSQANKNAAQQQNWERAVTMLQILGYSTEQIAEVLGIPEGISTLDALLQQAGLENTLENDKLNRELALLGL